MQLDAHNYPNLDPPRDEGRTLPQSPIFAVPVTMYQADPAMNESLVLDPATGTSSKDAPDTTHTEQNSNTVDEGYAEDSNISHLDSISADLAHSKTYQKQTIKNDNTKQLTLVCLNACGLKSKLNCPDFVNF